MNKHISFICLFLGLMGFAQKNAFTPVKGMITFSRQEIVTDKLKCEASVKNMLSELTKSVIRDREDMEEPIDSSNIRAVSEMLDDQNIVDLFVGEFMKSDDRDVKFHHIYNDEIIYEYVSQFDFPTKDYYEVINAKSSVIKSVSNDSTTVLAQNKPYEYSNDEVIKFEEFRNEIKEINGFKCFKVILEFKSGPDINKDEGYNLFLNSKKQIKELWVTEQIRSLYHPVLKYKSILEKYYPLEVSESNEVMDGFKTIYTIYEYNLQ